MEHHNTAENIPCLTLGELEAQGILTLGRGKIISKKDMLEHPGPYPVYSSSAAGDGEIGRYGCYMFDDERITWSIDGGGKLFYRNHLRYCVTNVGGWIKVTDPRLLTKYLYYVLIDQWEGKSFDYVKKAHPSVLREIYKVPMLPVERQAEIVRMLDTFLELIDTLEAELEARRRQYSYYRDWLIGQEGTEKYLAQVCRIVDCPHTSPQWQQMGVAVIRNYNLVDGRIDQSNLSYVSEEEYLRRVRRIVPQKDDLLFSREAPIGNVAIIEEDFRCCQGQRVVLLRPDPQEILPKYLLELLQSGAVRRQLNQAAQGGSTVSNFNLSALRKLRISVPDLKRQAYIQKTLEKFDRMISQTGISGEIAARKRQYRYYREKLLR